MAITSAGRARWSGCRSGDELHPGYWTQAVPLASKGLKLLRSNRLTPISPLVTYREDCPVRYKMTGLTQDPAFVGLISMVTGSTLQEDIAATARQLLLRGRNILGFESPETIAHDHHPQL